MAPKTGTRFDNPEFGINVIGLIGSGGFGNSFLCKNGDNYCVLKVARYNESRIRDKFNNEGRNIEQYGSNASINIFVVGGVTEGYDLLPDEPPFLIMDYVPGISLHDLLEVLRGNPEHSNNFKRLYKYKIIFGIAHGLSLLHKAGVAHLDIKPGNIFIDQDFNPHIGDFGDLSPLTETSVRYGTDSFLPPEAYQEDGMIPCGPAIDVYGFGCTLFQIITYEWPFNDKDVRNVLIEFTARGIRDDRVERGEIGILEEDQPLYEIVKMCWNQDPEERPTMDDISHWIYDAAPDMLGEDFEEFNEYACSIGIKTNFTGTAENINKAIANGFAEFSSQLREIAESEGVVKGEFENTIRRISDGRIRPPTITKRAYFNTV